LQEEKKKKKKKKKKKRKSALLENISEANGFGETNEDSRFEIVEKVIRQVLLSLSQLSKVWKVEFFFFSFSLYSFLKVEEKKKNLS